MENKIHYYLKTQMRIKEFFRIIKVIRSARNCEEFLWGELNGEWGFEEWKRMLAKRVHKIVKIDLKNPHWKVELKKRLMQNACISIAMMNEVDHLKDGVHDSIPSNLPEIEPLVRKCEAK